MTSGIDEAAYDEFESIAEIAAESEVAWDVATPVSRRSATAADGTEISLIQWGDAEPEVVYLHGGGQNAHTWDVVAMMVGRPALAVDLPGHGHSSWRTDQDYRPVRNAESIASSGVIERVPLLVGMSAGGLTAIRFAATHPELVQRLVIVDVAPGSGERAATMTKEERGQTELARGPRTFDTFDEMVAAAAGVVPPGRSLTRLRRGVRNNSRQLPDGRWSWRYDSRDRQPGGTGDYTALWEDVSALTMPTLLVQGGSSAFVNDDDVAEFARRVADFRHVKVAGASHAVQSDRPRELSDLLIEFGGL